MNKLIIIGASGHGKVIADIAVKNGYEDIVFLDDDEKIQSCAGFPVVERIENYPLSSRADYIVAIGAAVNRKRIQDYLEKNNCHVVSLVHPAAEISRRVEIGVGSVVMAGAVINSDTIIGKGCIINTGASIDHDGIISDYVHISVGAHLAGHVKVGNQTWIGAGAIVLNNISICKACMIGAGAVVIRSICKAATYVGVPAKELIKE